MTSAERLKHDLERGPFLAGEDHGRWRLVNLDGVIVVVAVSAEPLAGAPDEYNLRLVCEGYPDALPLGVFWDPASGRELADEQWPVLAGDDRAFRTDWRGNGGPTGLRSLYIITDAQTFAIKAASWLPAHALEAWRPAVGITCYLEVVYDRLHSPRYLGDGRPARPPAP
jgi:hypothetical protein